MGLNENIHAPVRTTHKNTSRESLKKLIAIFSIVFVMFVLPASVNVALSSQDARNSAQVIDDKAAVDVKNNTNNMSTTTSSNDNVFWKVYPFAVGFVIIIWGGLIFIYFGTRSKKRL